MKFETMKIADLISEISMGPFGSNIKVECFVAKGIPVLNGSNLDGFTIKEDSFRYITEEKADSLGKANAHKGDVIITHRGTLGQIAFIPQDSLYDRYVISQSQFRVRCNKRVLPEYLVYYFHTKIGQYKLLSNASQVGVPALARPTTTFQNIKIEVPDIENQRKIVNQLETIRRKIDINNAINDNLEEQIELYYQYLFVTNAKTEWKKGTISDLGDVIGGGTPSKARPEYYTENGIGWITPKDLATTKAKFISHGENDISELGLKNSSATIMPKGTILFSSRAPIGYIAIASGEVTTNQGFKSVVPHPEIGTAYVYSFIKHNIPVIEGLGSGTTFKEVSGGTMRNVPAIIPDEETLSKFTDFCTPLLNQQYVISKEIQKLTSLRDYLLPLLMSGQISI